MDIHVGVDVGGTFTDLAVNIPSENRLIRYKLPSTPEEPDRAIIEGLKVVLEKHSLAPFTQRGVADAKIGRFTLPLNR